MSEETTAEPGTFERFLIHHRPICEVGMCMKPTVRILGPYKNPKAVCIRHFQETGPLSAETFAGQNAIEPYSDEDLEQLYRQEPLPPNQISQLPAEEQPIESEEYAEY